MKDWPFADEVYRRRGSRMGGLALLKWAGGRLGGFKRQCPLCLEVVLPLEHESTCPAMPVDPPKTGLLGALKRLFCP